MSRRCLALGLCALMWASGLALAEGTPGDLTEGLRLYIPFDGSAAPSFCDGAADVHVGAGFLGPGRVGGGFNAVGTASASISALGNFHRPCGTIAFWHRPHWQPSETGKGSRMILKQTNFQLAWNRPRRILWFMTGKTVHGAGYKWDYSISSKEPLKWPDDAWRHFAVTWDSATGQKQLFLDGKLMDEGTTEWLRSDGVHLGESIQLGDATAQGLYDEWAIWDRVLPASEIAFLAAQPDAAAKALGAAKQKEAERAAPVRFDLIRLNPVETIVDPGEVFQLPTFAHNQTGEPIDLVARLSLVDAFGGTEELGEKRIRIAPRIDKRLTFDLHAKRNGVYKLRADMDWQGQTFRADLGGFAVWPKGKLKPSVESFFGHHINSWFGGAFVRQAERLGLSWQRNHNMLQTTWWKWVQPEPGEPQWAYDFQLGYCKQAGMFVLGEFFATPYWAADPPQPKPKGKGAYPKGWKPKLDLLDKYVRMTVNRYKDTIRVWEVWNEPDVPMFWQGTPEEFGRLSEVACRAAKAADPTCTVLIGGFTGAWGRDWYERAGKGGAFKGADGISYHGYARKPGDMRKKIELFRGIAKQFAPPGKTFELWDSEWGVQDTTFYVDGGFPDRPEKRFLPKPSFLDGAARVVKADCIAMALGVKRSFYYLHNGVKGASAYHNRSSMEFTRTPRPKLMARVALESLVRGAKPKVLIEEGGMTAVVFSKGDDRSLAAVWLTSDGERELGVGGVKVFDLFANPVRVPENGAIGISTVPLYLDAPIASARLESLLRNATRSLQSGKGVSDTSVSVQIAGPREKPSRARPGERVRKQIVLMNNGRTNPFYRVVWSVEIAGQRIASGTETGIIKAGRNLILPIDFVVPNMAKDATGRIRIESEVEGHRHRDAVDLHVAPDAPKP